MILRVFLIINLLLAVGADFASAQIVSITDSNLRAAIESVLGKAPGASITTTEIATLVELSAPNANITDLTGLEAARNLTRLDLGAEYVVSEGRLINSNSISDLSPLAELTRLTRLHLDGNNISDISPLAGLTNLVILGLWTNSISDISALAGLTNLFFVGLWDNNISDIAPLVANRGLGQGEEVNVGENPLSDTSIHISMGILVGMLAPVTILLNGSPLVTDGQSTIAFYLGLNLIGLPLRDVRINRVSDLLTLDGLSGNALAVILTGGGEFKLVGRAGDPGDISVNGGQGFILIAQQAATVGLSGDGWSNGSQGF